jgi:anti-sigma regulatory factor (Ser/Thr protein kinase)
MDRTQFATFQIEDRSYTSIAKREIKTKLKDAGFDVTKAGEIDIIVSELCTNLVKHADNGGKIILRLNTRDPHPYCELICIDTGPGTNDIKKMMRDGASSVNTLGQGLGAISRLSDVFQIYSAKDWGTIAYVKKFKEDLSPRQLKTVRPLEVRIVQEPIKGESVCGDGYAVKTLANETILFVGDGLGHGEHAHEAIGEAINAFNQSQETSPIQMLREIHTKVKRTRGLVACIANLNHNEKKWRIAGIGNIATRLYDGLDYKSCMPYKGIIGLNIGHSMNDIVMDAHKFQSIVMCSDGIKTKWDLSKYTSLLKYDPAIMAACIFKDHARHTDEMTVVVGKVQL